MIRSSAIAALSALLTTACIEPQPIAAGPTATPQTAQSMAGSSGAAPPLAGASGTTPVVPATNTTSTAGAGMAVTMKTRAPDTSCPAGMAKEPVIGTTCVGALHCNTTRHYDCVTSSCPVGCGPSKGVAVVSGGVGVYIDCYAGIWTEVTVPPSCPATAPGDCACPDLDAGS